MIDYNSSWSTPEAFEVDIRKGVAAKEEVDNLKEVARTGSYNDLTDKPTKSTFGLENVDNTSDLNKPISTATQTALDGKVDKENGKGLSTNDFTTSEKEKLAELSNYDDSTIKAEIATIANSGVKNLLKDSNPLNQVKNGIEFTKIEDGHYHVKGTNTSDSAIYISCNLTLEVGKEYFINSNIVFNGAETLQANKPHMHLLFTDNWSGLTSSGGKLVGVHKIYIKPSPYQTANIRPLTCRFVVNSNETVDDDVWLMIRDASITDDTFVPYAPSNRELYEMLLALTQGASIMSYTDDIAND